MGSQSSGGRAFILGVFEPLSQCSLNRCFMYTYLGVCYPLYGRFDDKEGKAMKTAIYARVSTEDQTTDNQSLVLEEVAKKMEWDVVETFTDIISGAKGKRQGLDGLMRAVRRNEVDMVMVWDVSRLGRSLSHLVTLLEEFHAKKVELYFHQQGLDTTTPSGKAMFGMMGVFAEYERGMISERVHAGLQRARSQGKRLGRPPVTPLQVQKIRKLRQEGLSLRKIAKKVGLSVGKVHSACVCAQKT